MGKQIRNRKPAVKLRSSRLNFLLISFATVMLAFVLVYAQVLVSRMARDERTRIQNWAFSTQRQADLAQRVRALYANMETEERQYAMVWSFVYEQVFSPEPSTLKEFEELRLILLRNNRPFILVDQRDTIIESHDPGIDIRFEPAFTRQLQEEYATYPPILIDAQGIVYKLYFKPSEVFFNIRDIFTSLDSSFSQETLKMVSAITVPVILTDAAQEVILAYANMDEQDFYSREALLETLREMRRENEPIEMTLPGMGDEVYYVYFESSVFLRNLRYIALGLLFALLLAILGILSLLNFAKRMEQNQVWWGMSKETAHQLGTPLSSLLAWVDYYKMKDDGSFSREDLAEIEKDVKRIELVTNRFSKIGSIPELNWENVVPLIYKTVDYLRGRSSSRVKYSIGAGPDAVMMAQVNPPLLEWVLENLCKNALNAIEDKEGEIRIQVSESSEHVCIDVEDTGKGMSKSMASKIFEPGFTTKTRGWGVGLTLCKRIVEDYHGGKIFVKSSVPKVGSVFRVILNKEVKHR